MGGQGNLGKDGKTVQECCVDFTERKKEEKLRRQYQLLSEATTDIILFIRHGDGRILEANEAAIKSYGYTREELLSLSIFDLRHRDQNPFVSAQMKEADSSGIRFEALHRRKDGSEFPVEVRSQGTTIGRERILLSIIRDITERKRAEKALLESRRKLSILNQIANIFLTIDHDQMFGEVLQIVLDATESKNGAFGYMDERGSFVVPSASEEVRGEDRIRDGQIIPPKESWVKIWGKTLIDGKSFCSNEPLQVPEGHIPILRALGVPIVYQGKTIGAFCVANKLEAYGTEERELLESIANFVAPVLNARMQRDKQEADRKSIEGELRQSEERYRQLVELSPEAIFVHIDGKFAYVNPEAVKLFNLSGPEDALGKSVFDFYHADYHEVVRDRMRRILERGNPIEPIEQKYVRPDGQVIDVEVKGAPITYKGAQGILTVARDISEHNRAKEALRKSGEKFRDLYDNAPLGYHEYGAEGRIAGVNRTELEMLGYTAEEMIGQPVWMFNVEEALARQQILDKLAGTLPPARNLERNYRKKDGTVLPVLIEDRLILDEKGGIKGIRCTVQDITERKRMEDTLRQTNETLQGLIQALPLAVVSLDLEKRLSCGILRQSASLAGPRGKCSACLSRPFRGTCGKSLKDCLRGN